LTPNRCEPAEVTVTVIDSETSADGAVLDNAALTGVPPTLVDVARAAGVWDPNGKGLGAVWFDADNDGDLDLYVANDATANDFYRNDGNGRFTDRTFVAGVCCSEDGKPESGMGPMPVMPTATAGRICLSPI